MSMSRRQAVRLLAATPLMGVIEWTPEEVDRATMQIGALRSQYQPQFFNEHEWRTVHVLVDLIIPRDERSGSATDANVPEFIDFMVNEGSEGRKRTIRQGLQWLDADIRTRTGKTFLESTDAQRRASLDLIAWPARAPVAVTAGVNFFNSFRDLTAAGFFSSKMGYDDLQYKQKTHVAEWKGCPDAACRKLGVSYDVMETRR
jgi:hypothetical protein